MRTITCLCERSFEADLPDLIDLDREPGTLEAIIRGDFLTVTCPHCERILKPEPRVRLSSRERGLDVLAVPETDRLAFYGGALEIPGGCELLLGYPELHERALVLKAGLDARAVEVLKYHLLAKALETPESEEEILVAYVGRIEDGKLRFSITGLRPGELALLDLPFDRYERAVKDLGKTLKTEPFSRIFEGPYRSVRILETLEG